MKSIKERADVTLAAAQKLIAFSVDYAEQRQLNLAIAVVDSSGQPVAFARMDGAALVTSEVALGKAKAAAYLKAPSKLFEDFVNSGATSMLSTPNVLPLQGGEPLLWDGLVVGAVGVSGADGDTDNQTAQAIAGVFAD
ncbi:GlcG/HbpS family heme-binding protein [Neisseria perflava]|uniref:GlcG/HbpS family heme-binding protein n=1 Tax=Neisseria perflava TaxID=33053 RepID=UPI0020A06E7C|nr:heme-binding protein [Neisseria perflava]MCP1659949.1 glc operon protein GlcG [Neisseria perflava]MCP1772203.1 glc operon protein GlcG [Neisseria perflava]